jgi:diguanylate cyclase (GGDEF)-like protein/PAS domain S-box-containing protein
VSERIVESQARDRALDTLLSRHPEAIFAALAPDGFRVAMPASLGLADHQIIPVPADRATMIDLVVPNDGMKVVITWERAEQSGISIGTVRTRTDPDRFVALTFIDVRHSHGVLLGAFTDPDGATERASTALAGSLLVPLRPRTATMHKSWHAVITSIDDRTTRMFGWTAQQIVGSRSMEFIHPDDQERALANWMEMLSKQESQRVRLRHRCQDGGWLWVEVENVYHGADNPEDAVVTAQISDISDEMAAHEALDRREELFRRLAESLPIGLLQLEPGGSIVYANTRLTTILGVGGAATLGEQLATIVERDRPALDAAFAEALERGADRELEVDVALPPTHELRRCAVTLIALTDREGAPGALACLTDITESARMREVLKAKATFDVLTGCYNRASTMAGLDQVLAADNGLVGVIFVDLDKFKPVNDTLGHAAGDELLVHSANRLTSVLPGTDIVGRIGGDEFLLVCPGLGEPAQALAIAERVREALHQDVTLSAGTVELAASIGVACAGRGATGDSLIAQADAAMYESKRQGQGRPVLYSAALQSGEHVRLC